VPADHQPMNKITESLAAIDRGDPQAAEELLPLVYDHLRELASRKLRQEKPGQTLQPTALVHEAYLRIARGGNENSWKNRKHFFSAAAEAMRRILIESARRKQRQKRGGEHVRVELHDDHLAAPSPPEELLALDEALEQLGQEDPDKAELVKLRYFAGMSLEETAETLGISRTTAYRHWVYARAWLYRRIQTPSDDGRE